MHQPVRDPTDQPPNPSPPEKALTKVREDHRDKEQILHQVPATRQPAEAAPTETAQTPEPPTKAQAKPNNDMLKYNRFKSINLGDFNASIGMDSKNSGAWDNVLGSNNSSHLETNSNGEAFLKFCSENNLRIINSIFRTKIIHRETWVHKPTGKAKRLDYITTRKYISKFITSCRAYRKTASIFDTDHYMVTMTLKYPTSNKKLFQSLYKKQTPKPKLNVSFLRDNKSAAKLYSDQLDSKLGLEDIPNDLEQIADDITVAIQDSLEAICPKIIPAKSSEPWLDQELQNLMSKLHKNPKNRALQKQIRERRKTLKDQYFHEKAIALNTAAEARQVEKEFQLAKTRSMHSTTSKITISKEKLTKHFKEHFSEKVIDIPPELEDPNSYNYLLDTQVEVNEDPPNLDEIAEVVKTFKNNKSAGTDNLHSEGLKYHSSKNLLVYLTMLTSLVWSLVAVPGSWLAMKMVCLYKKGLKSLAENYRALSIGSNLSKIIPRIILNRLHETYELNISESQFGFRKGRSTVDAIFVIKNVIQKHAGPLVLVFVDLTAAYDHIPRDFLFRVLELRTGAKLLVYILRKLYDGTTAYVSGTKVKFDILSGCRQGGLESPTLFNFYFDFVLKVCSEAIDRKYPGGWGVSFDYRIPNECTNREQRKTKKMNGTEIVRWLLYADDLVLFCISIAEAQDIMNIMNITCKRFGLTISFKKTKVMQFNSDTSDINIVVDGTELGIVSEFCYLGHTIFNDGRNSNDLRIAKATAKFYELKGVLCDKEVHMSIRTKILEACVRPRLTYATQCWRPSEK